MEFLLDNKLVKLSPSKLLGMAYMEAAMDTSIKELDTEMDGIRSGSSIKPPADEKEERLLLSKPSGQLFAEYLDVPELAVEVERAVWQVDKELKAQQERGKEKAKLDAATGEAVGAREEEAKLNAATVKQSESVEEKAKLDAGTAKKSEPDR